MSVSRIYRVLRLITMLQSGQSFSVDQIARELEISRRTVFRDLNMLELARIPYFFDPQSGYRIEPNFFLPPINLTLPEALSLLILAGKVHEGRHLPLMAQGSRAAMKVESVLPPALRRHVGSIVERMHVSLGPVARHQGLEGIFEQLVSAVAGRNVCQIVYLNFHEQKQSDFEIHPLRLVFRLRAWYLMAWCPAVKAVRTFKIIRIRKLSVLRRTFAPRDIDVAEHFGQAWCMIPEGKLYDVRLRFDARVAGNVAEVQWHSSQSVTWNDDGGIDFSVRVDGLGEIMWWILGYGDQVEVLGPPQLRRQIADIARSMFATHSGRMS